jgi:uncharacterized protein DUF6881
VPAQGVERPCGEVANALVAVLAGHRLQAPLELAPAGIRRGADRGLEDLGWSEIGDDGFETRKVDEYRDGRLDYADENTRSGTTLLGDQPVPTLDEINADEEFTAAPSLAFGLRARLAARNGRLRLLPRRRLRRRCLQGAARHGGGSPGPGCLAPTSHDAPASPQVRRTQRGAVADSQPSSASGDGAPSDGGPAKTQLPVPNASVLPS